MLIQVLGAGCAKCRMLYENAKRAVEELGIDAMVEKVEDIEQIVAFDILMPPGLVVNGEVKAAGRVPTVDEIKKILVAAQTA